MDQAVRCFAVWGTKEPRPQDSSPQPFPVSESGFSRRENIANSYDRNTLDHYKSFDSGLIWSNLKWKLRSPSPVHLGFRFLKIPTKKSPPHILKSHWLSAIQHVFRPFGFLNVSQRYMRITLALSIWALFGIAVLATQKAFLSLHEIITSWHYSTVLALGINGDECTSTMTFSCMANEANGKPLAHSCP